MNTTYLYDERELGAIKNVPRDEWPMLWNTPIYQILPERYLECLIKTRKLRFGNVFESWEDPYELFFYKQNILFENSSIHDMMINIAKHHYGQCWSSLRDSDAMWRIYSSDKHSVRIRTTYGRMMDVLYQVEGIVGLAPIFGKVQYVEKEDIINWLKLTEQKGWGKIISSYGESLFLKRKEFIHESEYRFILQEWTDFQGIPRPVRTQYYLDIDPFDFIEEIALDPRLTPEEVVRMSIPINDYVDNKIPIIQSDLYKFEPVTIQFYDEPIIIPSRS